MGGGQLGRMFALAARKMGYRVHSVDPTPDSPMGQISDREYNASFNDLAMLFDFARGVDVVTYEFENIPIEALDILAQRVLLRPGRNVLHTTQNRLREKEFLKANHFPTVPFLSVKSLEELEEAVKTLGLPCVLKTADFGYDGKGQQKIERGNATELISAWQNLETSHGVVEKWLDNVKELSVVVARGASRKKEPAEMRTFCPTLNHHVNHILSTSVAPAPLPALVLEEAQELARKIADRLEVIGVLAVEYFLTAEGKLVVNELAPRPHNSGHFSFDACVTSQFEQQLRAVCGLPLGDPRLLTPVIMRNLLGEVWSYGTPEWPSLLTLPGLRLHLYGKSEARPGRKMGHYCVLADSLEAAREIDAKACRILHIKP
jgi:5-(carboxyamino)imidazole ribonucleotide synthase